MENQGVKKGIFGVRREREVFPRHDSRGNLRKKQKVNINRGVKWYGKSERGNERKTSWIKGDSLQQTRKFRR